MPNTITKQEIIKEAAQRQLVEVSSFPITPASVKSEIKAVETQAKRKEKTDFSGKQIEPVINKKQIISDTININNVLKNNNEIKNKEIFISDVNPIIKKNNLTYSQHQNNVAAKNKKNREKNNSQKRTIIVDNLPMEKEKKISETDKIIIVKEKKIESFQKTVEQHSKPLPKLESYKTKNQIIPTALKNKKNMENYSSDNNDVLSSGMRDYLDKKDVIIKEDNSMKEPKSNKKNANLEKLSNKKNNVELKKFDEFEYTPLKN